MIGVNKYRVETDEQIDVLKVDNSSVRTQQIEKLRRLRAERDERACQDSLDALTRAAGGEGNLLELAVNAARAKATVGEISDALEKVYGRHAGQIRTIAGVYRNEAGESPSVDRTRTLVDAFEEAEGRRPRILVAKMGQDGHDRGQKVIATAFADLGFDVDVGPLFQTPGRGGPPGGGGGRPHRRCVAGRRATSPSYRHCARSWRPRGARTSRSSSAG